uniref:Uncharacterized protein n=1 Tax=Heterosigma akashiwo TaxID=2829 RepID=A0A7S3XKI5_HETAK
MAAAVAEATAAARRAAEGAEAAAKGQRAMQQAILKLAEGQGNPPGLLFSPGSNDPEVDLTARRLGVQKVRLREVSNDSAISDIDLIEETRRYGDASKTC